MSDHGRFVRPQRARTAAASPLSRTAREARDARDAEVLPFRRSPAERRVRRMRRHWLVRWLLPASVAVVAVGAPAAFAWWLLHAPHFAVDEVRLSADSPCRRVDAAWVRDRLEPLVGVNLWRLDLGAAAHEVGQHPWIDDVGIRKQPPSTLVVRVMERREAALYRDPAGLWFVDTKGRPVAPLGAGERRGGLPILTPTVLGAGDAGDGAEEAGGAALPTTGVESPQLRAAVELLREIASAGPSWSAGLDEVEILATRDFRVHTSDLPFPLLVRAGTVARRAQRLAALLPWIEGLGRLEAVDLRFARRIIVERDESEINVDRSNVEPAAETTSAARDLEAT